MNNEVRENRSPRIMFLCNFSNSLVREKVVLDTGIMRSVFYRLQHKPRYYESDYAVWVSDYIEQFEQHPEFEFHIVAPMQGLKGESQQFEENGIYYHFYNCSYGLFRSITNLTFNYEERRDYPTIRKRISKIRNKIKPDLVILCGAENPFYSIGALDVTECPVYVILQTLLNSPKRIEMGVGTPYKRKVELEIFRYARYFCTSGEKTAQVIKGQNRKAEILPAGFPTHRPIVEIPEKKDFDFVFFAKTVAPYKGVEDALKALQIVKKTHRSVSLNIIGGIAADYSERLTNLIVELGLNDNVHVAGQYKEIKETFENVAKAKATVLPGLTAALNSTVRESMLMGLPTICYENGATIAINQDGACLLLAPIGDINALAKQMLMVLEQETLTSEIAKRGKNYAENTFSNESIVNKLLDNCAKIINIKQEND